MALGTPAQSAYNSAASKEFHNCTWCSTSHNYMNSTCMAERRAPDTENTSTTKQRVLTKGLNFAGCRRDANQHGRLYSAQLCTVKISQFERRKSCQMRVSWLAVPRTLLDTVTFSADQHSCAQWWLCIGANKRDDVSITQAVYLLQLAR